MRGIPSAVEDPRIIFDELLAEWPLFASNSEFYQPAARRGKRFLGSDVARISAVIGLVRHVYDTAGTIALLIDNERINGSIPLVRSAYESALTAVWLVQSRDQHGITAFLHEYTRGRRALQRDALQAASDVFRAGAVNIPNADPTLYEDKLDSTQQFRQMCVDLKPGGLDAYIFYRILSGYSHASMHIVDLYFGESEEAVPHKRRSASEALTPAMLLYLTASSLVWAGRAYSYLSKSSDHRRALRMAAARLGINPELQLSDSYYARHMRQ